MEHADRTAIANTWRAISTRNLPLANAAGSMAKVSQELSAKLGDLLRMAGDIEAIVEQAIFLQRAVLEDGKGFAIGCENGGYLLIRTPVFC